MNNQVFITYSYKDQDKAMEIANSLQSNEIPVWIDVDKIGVGDSIHAAITNGINASDVLVILLSVASVNSDWVVRELNTALSKDFDEKSITLLPVLLENCNIPKALEEYAYIDMRENYEIRISSLIESINTVTSIDFKTLNPSRFECLVADFFISEGFTIKENKNTTTSNYDFMIEKNSELDFNHINTLVSR